MGLGLVGAGFLRACSGGADLLVPGCEASAHHKLSWFSVSEGRVSRSSWDVERTGKFGAWGKATTHRIRPARQAFPETLKPARRKRMEDSPADHRNTAVTNLTTLSPRPPHAPGHDYSQARRLPHDNPMPHPRSLPSLRAPPPAKRGVSRPSRPPHAVPLPPFHPPLTWHMPTRERDPVLEVRKPPSPLLLPGVGTSSLRCTARNGGKERGTNATHACSPAIGMGRRVARQRVAGADRAKSERNHELGERVRWHTHSHRSRLGGGVCSFPEAEK